MVNCRSAIRSSTQSQPNLVEEFLNRKIIKKSFSEGISQSMSLITWRRVFLVLLINLSFFKLINRLPNWLAWKIKVNLARIPVPLPFLGTLHTIPALLHDANR